MKNVEIQLTDLVFMIVSWSIILFGIVLAIVLFFKRDQEQRTRSIIAALLFISSLFLANQLMGLIGLARQFWALYILPLNYSLSIPPLVYFYFKFKLTPESSFQKQDIVHFLLPLVQALFYLIVGCSPLTVKTNLWRSGWLSTFYTIEDIVLLVLASGYALGAFRMLAKNKQRELGEHTKGLLYHLLGGLLLMLFVHLSFNVFGRFYFTVQLGYINYILLLALLLWISLRVRWYYFLPIQGFSPKENTSVASAILVPSVDQDWFEKTTERLFVHDKIFLNADLDLTELAKAYGTSKHNLSVYCKTVLDKNINELINHYRVEHVLKCFAENQHAQYNILSIGYSAGFSSKSTFYRVFKNTIGCTPTEFIKQKHR